MQRRKLFAVSVAMLFAARPTPAPAQAFDHAHAAWTALLRRHVRVLEGGRATQVRYTAFAQDRSALKAYLDALSAVPAPAFEAFTKPQQMAFLVNAYNAFTVELILTRYPRLESIKDLGSLLQSPWKRKWVRLLGAEVSLDDIEHGMLRQRGRYDDFRVHFAVNCASIGCPALREEAFVADRLDAQLDEMAQRFLSDRSRNRYNVERRRLEVSKIFDWFGVDWTQGQRGVTSLTQFLARYAEQLADAPADRERVRAGSVPVDFLDYDWRLNDAR
ncbi:Protein of unknown function, DUF547 [Burkholderiales bacterium JOSHI_001]|nr:Protein of unknown function, DUF547 [Burkholderiales bacterium JOSHI_001]